MRKVDPAALRASFEKEIVELSNYSARVREGLSKSSPRAESDITRLMSTNFLTLYVTFERFVSDLFLAYINRDSSKWQRYLENRIRNSLKEKVGVWVDARVRFEHVKHMSMPEIETAITSSGRNLTFESAGEIQRRASDWLASAHAARIKTLTVADERLIDTAKAIRDFIAHDSPSSKARMNSYLASIEQHGGNTHLCRGPNLIHNIGLYLKAACNGDRRIAIYAMRLRDIAQRM